MSQKSLSYWLKFVIIIMALCALAVHTAASLMLTVSEAEEIDKLRMPWLIFLWASAIPILFAVIISWKTAANIGIGNAFCMQNAKHLKNIATCSAVDAAWVLIGETVLLLLNMNHPGIFLFFYGDSCNRRCNIGCGGVPFLLHKKSRRPQRTNRTHNMRWRNGR